MSASQTCPVCGSLLPGDAPRGLCPKCLLAPRPPQPAADAPKRLPFAAGAPAPLAHVPSQSEIANPKSKIDRLRYFGDYELLEELARGGMGVVYKARQVSLNRTVAVKMILSGQLAGAMDVQRFRQEAEAAANLQHPNIVAIHEVGEHEDQHYFSMDFVAGRDLADLAHENPLPAKRAAGYVQTVAEAIHYAHGKGVLHRDLKPSNILIDANDQPRVTDFGLAKRIGVPPLSGSATDEPAGAGAPSVTLTGQVLGTPAYMAPEQASGKSKEVGPSCDVYSLGAILYELLTGRPPFAAETPLEILVQVVNAEPVSPHLLNPSVPRDLETICLKCLEKAAPRRYATAHDLADELGRFLREEPIRARPASAPEKLWRWCRRKPALAGALAALHLVFAVGLAGILWEWRRAEANAAAEGRQRKEAEDQRQRAESAVTRLEIDRAENLFANDHSSRAVAYVARLLRQQPTNRVVAERLLSALSHRNFCLPIFPLHHGASDSANVAANRREAVADETGADGQPPNPAAEESANRVWKSRPSGQVTAGEFSPDGQLVVTASEDGTARIWNPRTGQLVCPPIEHNGIVTWAQFSPDSQRVVTASRDKTARIWNPSTGQPLTPSLPHGGAVEFASFSPDGHKVVTASADKSVRLWDATTGQAIGKPIPTTKAAWYATFSSDGKRLLAASMDYKARVFDADSGDLIAEVLHPFWFRLSNPFPQLNPRGDRIAVHGDRSDFKVLELGTNRSSSASLPHTLHVNSARFSRAGDLLATGSEDTSARIWDVQTGEPVTPSLKHEQPVLSVDFSPDGQRLLTGSKDRTARIWDVRTGQALSEGLRHDSSVRSAKFSPDGQRVLAILDGNTAWLWDLRLGQPLPVRCQHENRVKRASFSPDGARVLTAAWDGTARIWDARTGQQTAVFTPGDGHLEDARFSPDGRRVVTTSEASRPRIWDAITGNPLGSSLDHVWARNARFSPDGKSVVTAGEDDKAKVWDVNSGQLLLQLSHSSRVKFAEFSRDSRLVVTASDDKSARIWDAHTGEAVTAPLRHTGAVGSAEFSLDGNRVITASSDNTACLWDARTGQMLVKPLTHADAPASVQFSRDGQRIVTAAGTAAQIWDVSSGKPMTLPLRHISRVNSARFSSDGSRLVTACHDGSVRIWDAATGHLVQEPFRHASRFSASYAEFSPDGRCVVSASPDHTARVWELAVAPLPIPNWLPDLAEAMAGQSIDSGDTSSVVPVSALLELKQQLAGVGSLPPRPMEHRGTPGALKSSAGGMDTGTEDAVVMAYYQAWAQWFFAPSATRSCSPSSPITVPEYVQRRIEENTRESLQEAMQLSPTSGDLQARLAAAIAASSPTARKPMVAEAPPPRSNAGLHRFPPRTPSTSPNLIDLSAYYNVPLDREWPDDQTRAMFSLSQLPRGVQTMNGVEFDIRGIVLLLSSQLRDSKMNYPKRLDQIPVGRKCRRVHFLHAATWSEGRGAELGSYALHYADGQSLRVPIVYGEDVKNTVVSTNSTLPSKATVAWTGTNSPGSVLRLFRSTWVNPRPEIELSTIDFSSEVKRAAPFLIAITAE